MATIAAVGRDGTALELDAGAAQGLRAALRGPVLLASDPGYDETRAIWNAMIDRRPALIVRCLGASDVIACVRFAREHGLALSVRGGGHNIAGLALAEGGLLVDLSLMRGVFVDAAARIARAQGGCLLGDVDRETQLHGLAAVLGFVSATGIGGLTLGGGFGYLSRRFGWTSDSVRSLELVTAEGQLVRASEKENAGPLLGPARRRRQLRRRHRHRLRAAAGGAGDRTAALSRGAARKHAEVLRGVPPARGGGAAGAHARHAPAQVAARSVDRRSRPTASSS